MVYKPIAKSPYIEKSPNNSGIYLDTMKMAVEKISFKLEVHRIPKAHGYEMLKSGEADLYASGEYKKYRSKLLYYFPNGLYRNEDFVCLTSFHIPNLHKISEINKHNLTWFLERGSSWSFLAKKLKVNYRELNSATLDNAVDFISAKRPAMFLISKEEIDQYVLKSKTNNRKFKRLKIHEKFRFRKQDKLHVGFSKFYKDKVNKDYSSSDSSSVENSPVVTIKGSVVNRLEIAFQQLIESGAINTILNKYKLSPKD